MPSHPTRRDVLGCSGIALCLGIGGCSRASSNDPAVSNETAKERALAAERAHLTERLRNVSCFTDWGTTPTTVGRRATVTDRTSDGVYVEVTHPYWYSTDGTEADLGSNALYVGTDESAERECGDSVSISC